jgi:hypothetical protein
VVVEPLVYRLQRKYCPSCQRRVEASAPGVLPKSLFGNQLVAHVLTSHYVHGGPMGRVAERLGLQVGALLALARRVAHLFRGAVAELGAQYRRAEVRHADGTTWRTDGQSGYAWLFATERLSIFLFRRARGGGGKRGVGH